VAAAVDGTLTETRLAEEIAEAAHAQSIATYRGELRRNSQGLFVGAFHTALQSGAADEILDSLRPSFDQAAEAIAKAKALGINAESTVEHVLATAEPGLVEAWQQLNSHLATINAIGGIAAQFGPRLGKFPLITEYANADNFRLDDRAIVCTDGNLETVSAAFKRPDQGHRTSPWFKVPLKLHTVDSMRDRYRVWAAAEWERQP
jgi:hypothetical protein